MLLNVYGDAFKVSYLSVVLILEYVAFLKLEDFYID